jgi:hypothetical protein
VDPGRRRGDQRIVRGVYGTSIAYAPASGEPSHRSPYRRALEQDRHGTELAALCWRGDGSLARAAVRIADGSWIELEPRATGEAPWGWSDRLWRGGTAVTLFATVDYGCLTCIPPLAEPARLPPGGGTAILNLIAGLAADQECPQLTYRGPYPTEQLFLALLESFRYRTDAPDPLDAFMAGGLPWRPAPHERLFAGDGVFVQLRDGVEKVVWHGRTYYRSHWQGVRRRAPRRVRDAGDSVLCSLWVLDTALEDHLRLDREGELLEIVAVPVPPPGVESVPPAVTTGIVAVVASESAPALEPFIKDEGQTLRLEWGPVERELLTVEAGRVRISNRVLPIAIERIRAAAARSERAAAGLEVLAELSGLLGDELRARAQRRLLSLPEAEQAARVERAPPRRPDASAREIVGAVEALLARAERCGS